MGSNTIAARKIARKLQRRADLTKLHRLHAHEWNMGQYGQALRDLGHSNGRVSDQTVANDLRDLREEWRKVLAQPDEDFIASLLQRIRHRRAEAEQSWEASKGEQVSTTTRVTRARPGEDPSEVPAPVVYRNVRDCHGDAKFLKAMEDADKAERELLGVDKRSKEENYMRSVEFLLSVVTPILHKYLLRLDAPQSIYDELGDELQGPLNRLSPGNIAAIQVPDLREKYAEATKPVKTIITKAKKDSPKNGAKRPNGRNGKNRKNGKKPKA